MTSTAAVLGELWLYCRRPHRTSALKKSPKTPWSRRVQVRKNEPVIINAISKLRRTNPEDAGAKWAERGDVQPSRKHQMKKGEIC